MCATLKKSEKTNKVNVKLEHMRRKERQLHTLAVFARSLLSAEMLCVCLQMLRNVS